MVAAVSPDLRSELRQYLLDEGLRPGDRIEPEIRLAERFAVSRGKMREVLTTLCHEGVLERAPRRGTVVRDLNPQRLGEDLRFRFELAGFDPADATEARAIIEAAILPLVLRRITPTQLRDLGQLVDHMAENANRPRVADSADKGFHLSLFRACGNQTLATFSGVVESLFSDELRAKYQTPECVRVAVGCHRALLDAIRRDDLAGAVAAQKAHFACGVQINES